MTGVAALSDDQLAAELEKLASAEETRCQGEFLAMLREDALLYRGRGTTEAERLRAFVMARLARGGLADAMTAYVVEELESGTNPYTVAAAARAVQAMSAPPLDTVSLLEGAIERIRPVDDFVHLDVYPAPPGVAPTTAVAELVATLRQQESRAQPPDSCCCAGGEAAEPHPLAPSIGALRDVELQNQDGTTARFAETFGGRAGVIAFFYTRCMTPDKCSRTVGLLGQVHKRVRNERPESQAVVAGITYDPDYDLPHRLYRYGVDRGLVFSETCQLLRSVGPFAPIRETLQLGVGYGDSTVNRHRIELILIDRAGEISARKLRRLWEADEIASAVLALDRVSA